MSAQPTTRVLARPDDDAHDLHRVAALVDAVLRAALPAGPTVTWRLLDANGVLLVRSTDPWQPDGRTPWSGPRLSEPIPLRPPGVSLLLEVQTPPARWEALARITPHLPGLISALLDSGTKRPRTVPTPATSSDDGSVLGLPTVAMYGLGRVRLLVVGPHCRTELPGRLAEVAVLVASHAVGLTGAELAVALDERELAPSTVRAAVTRLNRMIGAPLVRSRPYTLGLPVRADWLQVCAAAAAGLHLEAATRYSGRLLPMSLAPGVEALRERVHMDARNALLQVDSSRFVAAAISTSPFENDVELFSELARQRSPDTELHRLSTSRLAVFAS